MFLTVKRNSLLAALTLALAGIILASSVSATNTAKVFFNKTVRKIPVYGVEVEGDEKLVALTFDAAWGADKTQGILDIMREFDAKGTFFLVGFWIDKFEDEVKAIDEAGFEIGNHSRNHLNMPKLSDSEMKLEIEYVNERICALTGKTPKFFRAPFGDYSDRLMTTVEQMNMVGIQWSIDSLDWKGLEKEAIMERILPRAKSGDIILFHNNSDHVLDALPLVLTALKGKGFKFVTLSELVRVENFIVDNNGIQHKKP